MNKKNNIVGHCFRPSQNNDKVYMCCIRHTGKDQWTVLAKWGRRGKKLNVQAKATYDQEPFAVQYQQTLWKEQERDGYLDIESVKYDDHMKANGASPIRLDLKSAGIKENLEPEDWGNKDADSPLSDDVMLPAPQVNISKSPGDNLVQLDEVMVCIDNDGIEDRFDIGIEYLVKKHKDETMVYVYDKMGQKGEFFKVRFLTPDQYQCEAKQRKIKHAKELEKILILKSGSYSQILREFPISTSYL
jgi:predicted DNA-binding WGR domain protein